MIKYTKYFCPHCERFKHWYQTTTLLRLFVDTPVHCRHCGHEITVITKEFIQEAVMDKLK